MNHKFVVAVTALKKMGTLLIAMIILGYSENSFAQDKKIDTKCSHRRDAKAKPIG